MLELVVTQFHFGAGIPQTKRSTFVELTISRSVRIEP